MGDESIISLKGVSIFHNDNPYSQLTRANVDRDGELVLKDIDMEIRQGEFIYMIGKVGSGKSSLLRTLYADLPLLKGTGMVAGYKLESIRRSQIPYLRRKLGIIFQNLQLLPDKSVHDNLSYILNVTGWNSKFSMEARIKEILHMIGLEEKASKMPFELSGGERQHLVIGRALVNAPSILLADEPTGNLDPINAASVTKLFQEIAAKGTTVIMSTHNTSLIGQYPARTFLFSHNTIREISASEIGNMAKSED